MLTSWQRDNLFPEFLGSFLDIIDREESLAAAVHKVGPTWLIYKYIVVGQAHPLKVYVCGGNLSPI